MHIFVKKKKTHFHFHEEYTSYFKESKQMRSSSQGAAILGKKYQEKIVLKAVFAYSFSSASHVYCVCVWTERERSAFSGLKEKGVHSGT